MTGPTNEQQDIVDTIQKGCSCIVMAVAGSGKTTTVLYMAKAIPEKQVLFLTYSANLKADNRKRGASISNLEIHSFHSFAYKYYSTECADTLKPALRIEPTCDFSFSVIVVDETQDMDKTMYLFLKKVLDDNSNNKDVTFLLLGDEAQCIYQYRGSDARYLTLAACILGTPMMKLTLSESFRLTKQMCGVINHGFQGTRRWQEIRSTQDVPGSVVYLKIPKAFDSQMVMTRIKKSVKEHNILPHEIFILAPTVRSHGNNLNPCVKLQQKLQKHGSEIFGQTCHIFVPLSDDHIPNQKDMNNKLCFMTYHQSKGREARMVVVIGVDRSYFVYYDRQSRGDELTEPLLVALSRAKEHLVIVECAEAGPVVFLDQERLREFAHIEGEDRSRKIKDLRPKQTKLKSVTQLCRHLQDDVVEKCMTFLHVNLVAESSFDDNLVSRICIKDGLWEPVMDLNGNIVTVYAKSLHAGTTLSMVECIADALDNYQRHNGYTHRNIQIPPHKRHWVSEDVVSVLAHRLLVQLSDHVEFEAELLPDTYVGHGFVDVIDHGNKTVWEVKCVEELRREDFLQLALYAYKLFYQDLEFLQYRFFLLNVRTAEQYELQASQEELMQVVQLLVCRQDLKPLSDHEFIHLAQSSS